MVALFSLLRPQLSVIYIIQPAADLQPSAHSVKAVQQIWWFLRKSFRIAQKAGKRGDWEVAGLLIRQDFEGGRGGGGIWSERPDPQHHNRKCDKQPVKKKKAGNKKYGSSSAHCLKSLCPTIHSRQTTSRPHPQHRDGMENEKHRQTLCSVFFIPLSSRPTSFQRALLSSVLFIAIR